MPQKDALVLWVLRACGTGLAGLNLLFKKVIILRLFFQEYLFLLLFIVFPSHFLLGFSQNP
jgi:hypothetical protein